MSIPLSAYLGISGLSDIGYAFYDATETIIGSRVTSGVTDAGDGWYSASATPGSAVSVRWDSIGTTSAFSREYFDPRFPAIPTGSAGSVPTTGTGTGQISLSSGAITFANGAVRTDIGMASANLDSQLAAIEAGIGGAGLTGPYTVSLSFVDANNTAVPLVDFAVVGQGLARANVNGVISFGLNAGIFAIVARPTSSVVFPNVSITVTSAGVTQVIAGTAILVPTPGGSTPSM